MANATAEKPEANVSQQSDVAPSSEQASSQEKDSQLPLPVVKVKKERKTDTPPPSSATSAPPIPSETNSSNYSSSAAPQDEQLRLLLQQTPSSASTTSSVTVNNSRYSPAVSSSCPNRILTNGQRTIDSYFGSKNVTVAQNDNKLDDERKTPPVDLESVRGIFGWTTLENVHIPFILRGHEKFTAVRIIEKTLLKKFLQALPPDVYSCTYIKSYFITDNEAKLLNEINLRHCDRQYGNETFSSKDLVVLLNDVEQLYQFLSTCYYKLTRPTTSGGGSSKTGRCGIVKIGDAAIPYVLRNDVRYVPLILFDQGSTVKDLDLKAEKLESWEMSYIKFCCKVAGISHEFLQQDSCSVISIDDLQQTLRTNFKFEEWWPSALPVLSHTNSNVTQQIHQQQVLQNSRPEKEGQYSASYPRMVEKVKNDVQSVSQRCARSSQQSALPRALPASGWYDPNSGVITDAIRGPITTSREHLDIRNVAPINSRTISNSNINGNQNGGGTAPTATSVPSYSIPELLPPAFQLTPTLPLTKLQAYLYSGQYWGSAPSYLPNAQPAQIPMVYPSPSMEPAYSGRSGQVVEHHRKADHSLKSTSNLLQAHPGRMPSKSNYNLPMSNGQIASGLMLPPMLQMNSEMINRDHHKDSRSQDDQRSPFYPDGQYRGLPKVASSEHTMAGSILNGLKDSTSNGNRTTGRSNTSTNQLTDSFLSKHLLSMNRSSPRLENFVVAPGNVQSLAGKMSSPKPANQVPAHVSNYQNCRLPGQVDVSKTLASPHSTSSNALLGGREINNSKLHQLLSSTSVDNMAMEPQDLSVGSRNSSHNSSKPKHSYTPSLSDTAGGYEVQHLNVSGMKFRAIITVMSHSKGPPMVPLSELERKIVPRIQVDYYEHILTQGLGIRLQSCNRAQADILKKYVHVSNEEKSLLLICGEDLKRCLPHLQQISFTMTQYRTPHIDGVQSKRLRLGTEAVT